MPGFNRDNETNPLGGGYGLRAPNLSPRVVFTEIEDPEAPLGRRRRRDGAPAPEPQRLDEALAAADMKEVATAEIEVPAEAPLRALRRGAIGVVDEIEFDAPAPPPDSEQVVLMIEENGTVTWHLPEQGDLRRGGLRRYRIPVRVPIESAPSPSRRRGEGEPETPTTRRGLFSTVGRKILKVLVFPATDVIVGAAARWGASKWEESKAPYGVRTFTRHNFREAKTPAMTADEWKRMGSGPALLFVHGTFSTAHGAFNRLSDETLGVLGERYGDRVFAFNHYTLSDDPKKNVEWFCSQIPDGVSLDLDIVCHSRGGLVSRTLAVGGDELGSQGRVAVKRIVFVGTPNEGTVLASGDHMVTMLDRYTNIVQFLPDGPLEIAVEGVLAAVKILAHAGLKHLPGLRAQDPKSEFLEWLWQKDGARVESYALAADFEPGEGGLRDLVKQTVQDTVVDGIFSDAKNDLVVPTLGVGESTKGSGFPLAIERRYTFAAGSGVSHTNFFGDQRTAEKLMEWLPSR